jgi:hypothetical protein
VSERPPLTSGLVAMLVREVAWEQGGQARPESPDFPALSEMAYARWATSVSSPTADS